jgi:hypothetical protein
VEVFVPHQVLMLCVKRACFWALMVFFDILKAMIECLCGGGGCMLLPYLLGVEHGCCCCY